MDPKSKAPFLVQNREENNESEVDGRKCPWPSGRLMKTIVSYMAFFTVGMNGALYGATLLDLQRQSGADKKQTSMLLTWLSVGRVAGVLTVGAMFDRCNQLLILLLSMVLLTVSCIAVPFCAVYSVLSTVLTFNGYAIGAVGSNLNPLMILLWGDKSGPYIQLLQFTMAVGSTVGPLLVEPFKHRKVLVNQNQTSARIDDDFMENTTLSYNNLGDTKINKTTTTFVDSLEFGDTNMLLNMTTGDSENVNGLETTLLWVYLSVGIFSAVVTVMVTASYLTTGNKLGPLPRAASKSGSRSNKLSKKQLLFIILSLLVMYFSAGALEIIYGGFVLTYTVNHLGWAKSQGALATSVYWGFLAGGRGIGVAFTKCNRPDIVLLIDFIMLILSSSAMIFAHHNDIIMWACTAVFGFAIATVVCNGFLLLQTYTTVTGKMSSVMVIGLYCGMISVPALCGYLFQNYGEFTFSYICLGVAVLGLLSLMFALIFGKITRRLLSEKDYNSNIAEDKAFNDVF